MRPRDRDRGRKLDELLQNFSKHRHSLPGIRSSANRGAFVEQIVESIRRVEFITAIASRDICDLRADPSNDLFDPIKAAVLHRRGNRIDEAFWLTFLSVHFGKRRRSGWRLLRDVYGQLGTGSCWDWQSTSKDPRAFRDWLSRHESILKGADGVKRGFGNHRKYESLDAGSPRGTGAAIESYVKWIGAPKTHETFIKENQKAVGTDPRALFDHLYRSMSGVMSFGRMAKFDYLTMVGKLNLAQIKPGSAYLSDSTGPLTGARLLFGDRKTRCIRRHDLEALAVELGNALGVDMQVVEDSLCNWQKSPAKFVPFRG